MRGRVARIKRDAVMIRISCRLIWGEDGRGRQAPDFVFFEYVSNRGVIPMVSFILKSMINKIVYKSVL